MEEGGLSRSGRGGRRRECEMMRRIVVGLVEEGYRRDEMAWLDQTGSFHWAELHRRRNIKPIESTLVFKGSGY